ncbi:hypothetical protein E2C01_022871 [Portunus trituberculatus]|uniref:Uncharacterized protein n=1 Tax=Portunus trituberculatus TaxID=210409 RepID=A0A5B7E8F3_PORTR|nr:hypothetical protein [Portunus trituberculatus]
MESNIDIELSAYNECGALVAGWCLSACSFVLLDLRGNTVHLPTRPRRSLDLHYSQALSRTLVSGGPTCGGSLYSSRRHNPSPPLCLSPQVNHGCHSGCVLLPVCFALCAATGSWRPCLSQVVSVSASTLSCLSWSICVCLCLCVQKVQVDHNLQINFEVRV